MQSAVKRLATCSDNDNEFHASPFATRGFRKSRLILPFTWTIFLQWQLFYLRVFSLWTKMLWGKISNYFVYSATIYLGNKRYVLVLKRPFYACSSVFDDTKLLQMLYVNELRAYASLVFEPRTWNPKLRFRAPGQWCLPDFQTNRLY